MSQKAKQDLPTKRTAAGTVTDSRLSHSRKLKLLMICSESGSWTLVSVRRKSMAPLSRVWIGDAMVSSVTPSASLNVPMASVYMGYPPIFPGTLTTPPGPA